MAWRRFPGGRSGRRQRSATGDRPSTVDAMAYPGESALVLTAAPPPSVTGATGGREPPLAHVAASTGNRHYLWSLTATSVRRRRPGDEAGRP